MFTEHALKKETRKALMRIRREVKAADRKGRDWPCNGLCWELHCKLVSLLDLTPGFNKTDVRLCALLVRSLFREWPLFSGDDTYPVPVGMTRWLDPQTIYDEAGYRGGPAMWSGKKRGWIAYAKNRRKLLDFLIDNLK